jgi:hypothetical protein
VPAKKPAEYYTAKKQTELQEGVPWKPDGENLYLKKVLMNKVLTESLGLYQPRNIKKQ